MYVVLWDDIGTMEKSKADRQDANSHHVHADVRKEVLHNAVAVTPAPHAHSAAGNKSDQDDDLELQYLDQSDKNNLNNAKKKSFFQITSVTEDVNDENDSMDELDESRVDDLSTADVSKLSLQAETESSETEDPSSHPHQTGAVLNQHATTVLNPNSEANGNGPSRFKLVKVARIEPIKRGRWTCKDFPNEPQPGAESTASKTEQLKDNVSGSSSAASSVHYVPGENPPTENPLGDANSASQQPPPPSKDQTSKEAASSSNKKGTSSLRPGNSRTESIKDGLSKKESSSGDLLSLESLNVDMHAGDNLSESDESTSATGGAIDNKIEQAMDLVKSHLLFAVREEVEVLKEQIKELLEKNEQLQRENKVLRQSQSQGLQPHLPYNQSETAQPSRDQAGFQSLPGAAAPRPDGYQQPGEAQFAGMQATGGPSLGQAPTQQQALPQQQASQYGHIPPTQPQQQQQQHTLPPPPQTPTQLSQPPSQT